MAISSHKNTGAAPSTITAATHVPGLSDYLIETRMMMGEGRVEDCLKNMSDATLLSLGFNASECAKLKNRAHTV